MYRLRQLYYLNNNSKENEEINIDLINKIISELEESHKDQQGGDDNNDNQNNNDDSKNNDNNENLRLFKENANLKSEVDVFFFKKKII